MQYGHVIEWWRPVLAPAGARSDSPFLTRKPKTSSLAFVALMVFTFALLVAPQSYFPALKVLRIAFLSAMVAVLAHALHQFTHGQPLLPMTREMRITLVLAGWAVGTIPLSMWPGGSVTFLLDIFFKSLIIFWMLVSLVTTLKRLKIVAWGLTLMAVPLAMTGVQHFVSGIFLQGAGHGTLRILGYEAPLTENPNDLALMLNLLLPLSIGLLLAARSAAVRMLLIAIIALDVVAIIATFSRAGFLALAITFGLYLMALFKRGQGGWTFMALVLILLAMPFLPQNYVDRIATIAEIESDPTGSAQSRWADTVASLRFVASSPIIGSGLGLNALALNRVRGETWREVHNVYLEHAVELGIPGLILFLLLLKGCLRLAREVQLKAKETGPPALFCLAEAVRISLIAFAVAALYHPIAHQFYFYYFAGLAIAAKTVLQTETEGAIAAAPPPSPQTVSSGPI